MSERRQPVLGVLGGGQLARMLALAAAPLGVKTLVVDSSADACAGQVAPLVVADWIDYAALGTFAAQVDVVTFDFENVPAETARWLAERVAVFPAPQALAVAQDRLAEKTLFRECGLPTPDFMTVDTREQLDLALATVGVPAILKTRRLGYDGKGQFRLRELADAHAAWDALGAQASKHGLILEAFVPFERELSVLAVRGRDGDFRTWPLTRNWHVEGVLSMSLAPAPDIELLQRAPPTSPVRWQSDWVTSACSRWSCSSRMASCSATRWHRAYTIPVTGRSRARTPASSRTTCARYSACRWAIPARAACRRCSTGSATCPMHRRCCGKSMRTGTTTANRRGRGEKSATPLFARLTP